MSRDRRLATIMSLLKNERIRIGYTQVYVASKAGLNQSTYSRIEGGTKEPNRTQLINIAKVLELKNLIEFFE